MPKKVTRPHSETSPIPVADQGSITFQSLKSHTTTTIQPDKIGIVMTLITPISRGSEYYCPDRNYVPKNSVISQSSPKLNITEHKTRPAYGNSLTAQLRSWKKRRNGKKGTKDKGLSSRLSRLKTFPLKTNYLQLETKGKNPTKESVFDAARKDIVQGTGRIRTTVVCWCTVEKKTELQERKQAEMCGPFKQSLGGLTYFVTFVVDSSVWMEWTDACFLKNKSEVRDKVSSMYNPTMGGST
ncbi:hypothetical protein RUM44_005622 [Polyplax serrata]|uniref:Uncharacterized protein n=1 Tax=Polyplax serrata TaxID=468196 RepID=A0ABR1AEC7_POLSC